MTIIPPDSTAALIVRLKAATAVTDKTGQTRIAPLLGAQSIDPAWAMPNWAVTFTPAGGPPGNEEVDQLIQRYDVACYGPGTTAAIRSMNAREMWRRVDGVLVPSRSERVPSSFTAAGCVVHMILREGGPRLYELPDDWTKFICSYLVFYSGVPAA